MDTHKKEVLEYLKHLCDDKYLTTLATYLQATYKYGVFDIKNAPKYLQYDVYPGIYKVAFYGITILKFPKWLPKIIVKFIAIICIFSFRIWLLKFDYNLNWGHIYVELETGIILKLPRKWVLKNRLKRLEKAHRPNTDNILQMIDDDLQEMANNEKLLQRYIFDLLAIIKNFCKWYSVEQVKWDTIIFEPDEQQQCIELVRKNKAYSRRAKFLRQKAIIDFIVGFQVLLIQHGIKLDWYEQTATIFLGNFDLELSLAKNKKGFNIIRYYSITTDEPQPTPPQKTYWQLIDEIHGAKPFYGRAIERGYITDNGDRLQWNKSKAELAYFAELVYIKALNQNKVPQTNLAAIFGEIGKRLDSAKNGYLNNKKLPKWQIQIDSDFGNLFTE